MKKILYSLLFSIAFTTIASIMVTSKAYSQQGIELQCAPGTGGDTTVVCEPCVPGPYNICIPYTSVFSGENIREVVRETSEEPISYVMVVGSVAVGILLFLNGYFIYNKTKDIK